MMAGPRPFMSLIDNSRRDRVTGARLPQHPLAAAGAVGAGELVGFQTLQQQHHPHFSLAQHQRFDGLEEEDVGRMAGGGGRGGADLWTVAHEQQQRALVADAALRQRRVNAIQPLPTLANSVIQQGPGPGGQPTDWDGGGMIRHIGSISNRGRIDRNLLVDEQQLRLRQQQHQSLGQIPRGGEFSRGVVPRELFAGTLRVRDSRDVMLTNELMKSSATSHVSLLDDAALVEMPRAYQQRPAAAAQHQQQEQRLDPLTRNRRIRLGVEENGHAELVARYGDRSSSRNLERAHDAIGRGYQLENVSRKRSREEEANLDRDRLVRHRTLSGVDTSSPPLSHREPQSGPRQLKKSNQEIQQQKAAKYWKLQAEEREDNGFVQEKQLHQEVQQHKAKYWQQKTEGDGHNSNVQKQKESNQELQPHKAAMYWQQLQMEEDEHKGKGQRKERNQDIQKHTAAKYWQQLLPQEDDHDAKLRRKERNQEIQQLKGRYWKLQTEEDEHEEGQVTPPSPMISHKSQQQHSIESKTHLLTQEQDLMVISSRTEVTPKVEVRSAAPRNHSSSAYSSDAPEFLLSARPQSLSSRSPKAKESGKPEGDEPNPLGRSRDRSALARERRPLSPRYKTSERTLPRYERVGAGFESSSILTLDLSDMRRGRDGIRESQNHTRTSNSKSAGRLYCDGPHQKHQHQVQNTQRRERDLRSLNSSREFRDSRPGGIELDSLLSGRVRKESSGRTENTSKRKITSKTTAAAKDSRLVGEMTISVQKHGQRIVKVEEYKPRDTSQSRAVQSHVASLAPNKDHRLLAQRGGSFRCGSEEPVSVSSGKDRSSAAKRKEYEGRSSAATQEKTPGSQSSPRQHYLEEPTSQDRFPPYSQLVKDELIARTEHYESEPQRHHSIFTRLVDLRPETNPMRTPAEAKRNDSSLLPVDDKASLPSPSEKYPSVLFETSARNDDHGSAHEFPGFQISTRSRSTDFTRELESSGLKNVNRKNFVANRVPSRQAERHERPNEGSQKGYAQDISPRNESARKPQLESVVSRPSHYGQKVISLSEQGDLMLFESPKLSNRDQSKSCQEGFAWLPGDSGDIASLVASEIGAAEWCDQLPGNELKVHPTVIATGHRKDQILKKNDLDAEKAVQTSSSLHVEAVIPVENLNQENCEGRLSILSAECMPREESPSPNSKSRSTTSLPDCDHASPQSDLGGKQPISECKPSDIFSKNIQSVGKGCTPTWSGSGTDMDPSKACLDAVDFKHSNLPPAVEILSCLQSLEGVSKAVVLELHSDGDTENGLSDAPVSSSALSTPKEVRLFGANLNAHMGERIDLTPKGLGITDNYVVESSNTPAEDQDSVSVERNSNCMAVNQGLEKDAGPPVGQAGDESLSPHDMPNTGEQSVPTSSDALKDLKSIAHDLPLGQVSIEEAPDVLQEQHRPLSHLQKAPVAASAQGGQLNSSHAPGAHTWRRGKPSSFTPVSNANVFRSTSSLAGVIQSAGSSRSAQITAYVRKGNSLVRAAGPANLPSTHVVKAVSVMPGQARPLATKLAMMKPIPSRNTFTANPTTSKSYFSTSRTYLSPLIESDSAFASTVGPANTPKIPNINNDLGKSQSSAMTKTAARAVPRSSDAQVNSITHLIQHPEEQNEVPSSPELSVLHRPDDRSGAAGVCRSVDKTTFSHSTDLTLLPGNVGSRVLETPGSTNRLYVRRKANQLVVAPAQNSSLLSVNTEGRQANMLDHYFKRKTNQLVRSISGKGSLSRVVVQKFLGSGLSSNNPDEQGGASTLVPKKMRRGKGMRLKRDSPGRSSWVWTLNGAGVGRANNSSADNRRTGPLLFPWKRQNNLRTPLRSQKLRPLPEVKKGSFLFLMSKRLRKVRPVQPVYTRSADGFSLRRSGVMSVGGGNLKWTKSLEKRAKQASEEVTKAVAEAERRKREKKEAFVEAASKAKAERRAVRKAARGEGERIVWVGLGRYKMDADSKTLQRIQDSQGEVVDTDKGSSRGWAMASPLLTPRRSIIGGTVYLRVGNGNQLVRDPKTASRALASEKVRWSLHNARSRGAKKQQYCQFFTKFGKCNKESGKCPYIHDPEKVAVCTKFLKGNCTDVQCLLTHKVIPERMPDCSFFLEGLCTNENCPYRHVNVNPKASYCDGFLRGYCKDGDKCNKKHTYVCSVYAETGDCPDRSTCKFHHPKKKVKVDVPISGPKIGAKRKRRYFSAVEPQPVIRKIDVKNYDQISTVVEKGQTCNEGSMEFISLSNTESDEEQTVVSPSEPWPQPDVTFTLKEALFADEREKWIKPTFLLQLTSSTAVAH